MNNEGFIKLHRKMLEWAWADDPTVFYFFVKLIFAVNYKDKMWHGISLCQHIYNFVIEWPSAVFAGHFMGFIDKNIINSEVRPTNQ